MAAKRRYALPPEQLIVLAREARREGISFDEWWARAVRPGKPPILVTSPQPWPEGAMLWPSDSADRNAWRYALLESVDGWRRAYNNEPPTRQELAIRILEPLLGSRQLSAPLPAVARDRQRIAA